MTDGRGGWGRRHMPVFAVARLRETHLPVTSLGTKALGDRISSLRLTEGVCAPWRGEAGSWEDTAFSPGEARISRCSACWRAPPTCRASATCSVWFSLWGCGNRMPPTGQRKQQKGVFSQFWSLEVQDQGVSGLVSSEVSFLSHSRLRRKAAIALHRSAMGIHAEKGVLRPFVTLRT